MLKQMLLLVARRLWCFCLVLVLTTLAGAQQTVDYYVNPLDVSIADPQVLKDGGTYYLYGTTEVGRGFSVFTSDDLVHWSRQGLCYQKSASSWAQQDFWAPEVIKVGDLYYLYFTGYNPTLDRRNICVATSTSPLGPFVDEPNPVLDESLWFIDGHPYYDAASGKHFMYAVRTRSGPAKIVVAELADPPVAATGPATEIMTVTQPWEDNWVEAPFIVRHKEHYYMMYSGSTFDVSNYAVGYATASHPLGPWSKSPDNPILEQSAMVSGPGHNAAVASPDGSELYIVYHTHLTFAGGGARQLAIDRLQFTQNAGQPDRLSLVAGGATHGLQPLPSGSVPKHAASSDEFSSPELDRTRWSVFGEEPDRWQLTNDQLHIESRPGDIHTDNRDAKNIFLQHVPSSDFDIETRVRFSPEQNHEQAFLILWSDQSNYVRLSTVYANGLKIEAAHESAGQYQTNLVSNSWGNAVKLKIERRGENCYCYVAEATSNNWTQVGPALTFSSPQLQAGLGAISPGSGATLTARFNYFRVSYPASVGDWHLY